MKRALILLEALQGVTATIGGLALLAGYAPPPEYLDGSVFKDYTIPGLFLTFVIGGGGLFVAWRLAHQQRYARESAVASGLVLMTWITIQLGVIGFHWLQIPYYLLGLASVALATLHYREPSPHPRHKQDHRRRKQ